VAAMLTAAVDFRGQKIAVILTGANIDAETLMLVLGCRPGL
jgi:threonine dehydratase